MGYLLSLREGTTGLVLKQPSLLSSKETSEVCTEETLRVSFPTGTVRISGHVDPKMSRRRRILLPNDLNDGVH